MEEVLVNYMIDNQLKYILKNKFMYTICNYFIHNKLFKAGFLIGAGLAFTICGSVIMLLGNYQIIKYSFEK